MVLEPGGELVGEEPEIVVILTQCRGLLEHSGCEPARLASRDY